MGTHHNKQLGTAAECIVTAELIKRDWYVSTPEGDYAPYDRIITKGRFIHKVQVKSATKFNHPSGKEKAYKWTIRGGHSKKRRFLCTAFATPHIMSDIREKVTAIIVDKLGVDASEVNDAAGFTNDLGADSLDTVELIMEFEKEFNIAIPDDQAEKIGTVGQAIEYIENAK